MTNDNNVEKAILEITRTSDSIKIELHGGPSVECHESELEFVTHLLVWMEDTFPDCFYEALMR